ncbi:MAG TPA: amidohydrolase [Thermoanaerobaculia bacterium]|nr:amidohydrolase [Thermoanaerobaculia bacterium]
MRKAIRTTLSTLVLGLAGAIAGAQPREADLILLNGRIFTSDAARPYVEALAIRGERIIATGGSTEIEALAGPRTRRIDLGGRTVIPGINDAHKHVELSPADAVELEFRSRDPKWAEVKEALTASAVTRAPKGAFVLAYLGPSVWKDLEVTRDALDRLVPDHPVMLFITEHASILNSAALDRLGIREHQANPLGGRYERSADGRLTGVLREYASLQAVRKLADLTSEADALAGLRKTFSAAVGWGITTIQDMSNAIAPERCVALLEKVPTPIRIRVIRMPPTSPSGRDIQEGRPAPRSSSLLVTASGTKWMLDGTPLERTFEARDAGQHRSGMPFETLFSGLSLTFPPAEIEKMLRESLQDEDQLMVHVFGYNSAAAMLNAMQATGGIGVWPGRRVRFEHGDGLFPDLIPLAKKMGVVVVQNPSHLNVAPIFPGLFLEHAQPLRSLLAAGIPVALGSDGPTNPYLNIMFASTHPNRPSEAITREQAVTAYTLGSAYAEFAEKEKGSLEPGKLADLAVLSQDIFTVPTPELPKTTSVLTLVGGKVVYDASVLVPAVR